MFYKFGSANLVFMFYTLIFLNTVGLCLSEPLALEGDNKIKECEEVALSQVHSAKCINVDAPEMTVVALKIVDCRLSLLGKQRLECSYLRQKGIFKCTYPMTANIAKEALTILLDIFERCHTSRREYFQSEVASLMGELTSSAKMTESMHMKLLGSRIPLNVLRRITEIQQDAISVEIMVLSKARRLVKKASDVRRTLSDLTISSKTKEGRWKSGSVIDNCLSAKVKAEEATNEVISCVYPFGLCFRARLLDWIFSLTCTILFLLMIRRMAGDRDSPVSILLGTVLFALRSYTSSQNYTTFLEQFFLETLLGLFLLSLMTWLSTLYNVRS